MSDNGNGPLWVAFGIWLLLVLLVTFGLVFVTVARDHWVYFNLA